MSSNKKLYKVRLSAGFPANVRKRAGFDFQKGGEPRIIELTKDQLEALNGDEWITVKELTAEEIKSREDSEKKAKADAKKRTEDQQKLAELGGQGGSESDDEDEDAIDLAKLKRPELEKLATEMEIADADNKEVFPNVESLREAIRTKSEAESDDEDEDTTE